LTTLFGNPQISTATTVDALEPRRKMGWLPLLTVLFCISYGLMTMLIVEQGRTIDSQRALIRELFRDSMALNNSRMKALQERSAAKNSQTPKAESPAMSAPSTSTPSNATPSTQAQNQAPSSQAAPQRRARNQNVMPKQFDSSRPAADQAQDRQALIRI
jgi:cytoskeletal protein RodZ